MAGTSVAFNLAIVDADHAWSILLGRVHLDWKL